MNDETPVDASEATDELLRRVGRNLLLYQRIEHGLKVIVPFIHPKGSAIGWDALSAFQEKIKGATLGILLERFSEAAKFDPEEFKHELDEIVSARNKLVHGFLNDRRFTLSQADGREAAIHHLDVQFEHAKLFANLIARVAKEIATELERKRDLLDVESPASKES